MAENNCVVCFKNFRIYSVGECDHPVCFECSARMRVLCCQNECPMCRHEMEVVVFTEKVRPFRRLNRTYALYDKKHNIAFENDRIRDVFESLLQYACQKCYRAPIFDTFEVLNEHMKRVHDLYCCDLCADNLKIFPGEMRYYSKQELSRHRKIGDVDNRSHRGHPLCEFCRVRYLDRDELYKHLRKEHFFCHICDGEGIQQFYGTYILLRDHYREKHYLCEEGSCIDESMTSVFPTEIDLKAHKALVHFKNLRNKQAVKQARTLDLEFSLPPRSNDRRARFGHDDIEDSSANQQSDHSQDVGINMMASLEQDFPSLGNTSSFHAPRAKFARESNNRLTFNDRNFPALGSEASIKLDIMNSNDIRPSTSSSVASTNFSMQVDLTKSKEKKTKNPRPRKCAPSTSTNALTWVEKAKEKPPLEKIATSTAGSSNSLADPPVMNRQNFPNLQKKATACSDVNSNKTTKKQKKSSAGCSERNENKSPALRVDYREAIAKTAIIKEENAGSESKSAHIDRPKETKENRSLNLNRDNKTHSFLLNANRKKVKMKPDMLMPLNDLCKSSNSLPIKMAQLKLTNNSNKAQEANAHTVIDRKMKCVHEETKDEMTEKKTEEKRNDVSPRKNGKIKFNALHQKVNQGVSAGLTGTKQENETQTVIKREKNQNSPNITEYQKEMSTVSGSKYPPGFEKQIAPPPPPGFNRLKSPNNGLSDCGMIADIPFVYQQPDEFVARNSQLIKKVGNSLVERTTNALNEFKNMSLMFREGLISASDYHSYCVQNIEADKFEDVFVDLIALLPDIFKQQELWAVHQSVIPSDSKKSSSSIDYCKMCFQILKLDDAPMHYSRHGMMNETLRLCSSLTKY